MELKITTNWREATFAQGRELVRISCEESYSEAERLIYAICAATNFALSYHDVLELPADNQTAIAAAASELLTSLPPDPTPVNGIAGKELPTPIETLPFGVFVAAQAVMQKPKEGIANLDSFATLAAIWLLWCEAKDIDSALLPMFESRVKQLPYSEVCNFAAFFLRKLNRSQGNGAKALQRLM